MKRTRSILLAASAAAAICVAGIASELPDVTHATMNDHVVRVVDGDTVELRSGQTVRLLGIDTPETGEPFYYEAKRFLFNLVCHKPVRLEIDQQPYDVYYRLLAHIYVETEDGWILANAELLRAGLAELLFIPPNARYYDYFEATQFEAIVARRGLWNTIDGTLSVPELEADLVACVTEVVAVDFVIGRVEETRHGLVLHAESGDYGFNVRIALDVAATLGIESIEALVGTAATVTGVLACDVRLGPYITVETAAQLVLQEG